METSLRFLVEKARRMLKGTINHILTETKLPAFLLEGVLLDMLADVRGQMLTELSTEIDSQKEGEADE